MNSLRTPLVLWEIVLLISSISLGSLVFAEGRDYGRTSRSHTTLSTEQKNKNGDIEKHKDEDKDKGIANNMGGKSAKRFLRQSDEDNLSNRINGIPSFKRVEALMRVLVRIEALETSIQNNTSLTSERKARLIGLLEEVKTFIQERLDSVTGSGTTGEDTTPPIISSLMLTGVTTTTGTLRVHSNEYGTGYFVVVLSGATAPSAWQIKSGQDGSSGSVVASGSLGLTKGTTLFGITNLVPNTAYVAYFVATDLHGNTTSPISSTFMTSMMLDTTPPVIGSLTFTGMTSTGTTLVVNVSESGTGYYVALPNGSAIPTALQIKAGQDASSVTASIKGLGATSSGSNIFPVAGLSPSSTVNIFFTAEDTSGNLQPIPQALSITTLP